MTMADRSMGAVQQLGNVLCPSRRLLILDGGLAWMWENDRAAMDRVLAEGQGAGLVRFGDLDAALVDGVPSDRRLPVMGERMPGHAEGDFWRRVWIEARGGDVASRRTVGLVPVDMARLMLVDAEAIAAWNDDDPRDGLADVAFWGRDAVELARAKAAPPSEAAGEENVFNWPNMPFEEGLRLAQSLEALRSDTWRFAVDFRPHADHWRVMRDVRATATQSGELDLAGSRLCMFATTWGDGHFPVTVERDVAGDVLRIVIDLGDEDE